MKNLLLPLLLICGACGEAEPEPLLLTKEFYNWTCSDYENHTEIVITSETCDDRDSGLWYLIAETHLYTGDRLKRHLTKEEPCHYTTNFILIDEVCMEVEGVTLTAWVDPATWSDAVWGD